MRYLGGMTDQATPPEYFPRITVYPGRYLCHEDHFGAGTVNTITRDDGAVRTFEPLIMCPDRKAAEAHAEHLIAQEVAA